MKEFLKGKSISLVFLAAGALGGFLYWNFVGCLSGTCPIQSVWYWSTLWGAAVGYLVGDFINDLVQKRKNKTEEGK
ncbi:MAG: hypothetical protein K0B11_16745 [Mariniphaga sp.]|nr:hypothetical protein [Mariniphaga sp.]